MLSDLINLGKHSAIYGLSNALCSAIGFFLIPLYTRKLTPADYGVWELFFVTIVFFSIILELGLGSALFKSVLYDSRQSQKSLFSTAFFFIAFFAIIVLCVLYWQAAWLVTVFLGLPDQAHLFRLILFVVFFNILAIVPMTALRIREESVKYAAMNLGKFTLGLILNIYFVAVLSRGVTGIVYANVIQSGVFLLSLLLLSRHNLQISFSTDALSEMLKFGLPLVLMGISFTILNMADRYFLRHYTSIEEVGLYSIGYKIGMFMNIVVGSIQIAWPAIMFKVARQNHAEEFFMRSLRYVAVFLLFLWLTVSIFTKEIFILFTAPAFYNAQEIVPVVLFSYFMVGIYYLTAVGSNIKRKTYYQAFAATSACCVSLFLNYKLIPLYGMYGAAAATVVSFFVMTSISTVASLRLFPISYEWGKIARAIAIAFALYFLNHSMNFATPVTEILFKIFLVAAFPPILFLAKVFTAPELVKLQSILVQKKNALKSGQLG